MPYRRILTIQDISCVGQCSMTVALPILSACGHEVCILPSAVLSTHTGGFEKPVVRNLTDAMEDILHHWLREGISFDLIYTGYLGSIQAIAFTEQIMDQLLAPGGMIIVDPAMADHGRLYRGFDNDYAEAMKNLCKKADVVLPNVTEAAMLAGMEFQEKPDETYIRRLLAYFDNKTVVLTGAGLKPDESGAAIRCAGEIMFYHHKRIGRSYHGTGDIFASCFTGAMASGKDVAEAARIAADFTCSCIEKTVESPAHWYGVKFETALPELIKLLDQA